MASHVSRELTQGVYGVLGHDIGYTLSPLIFRQVFGALKWSAVYGVFDMPPGRLKRFLAAAADAGINGFNVTKPYKTRILDHLTHCDRTAHALGAVNTVRCRGSARIGFNTDVDGVVAALAPHKRQLKAGAALVLGAGGAARAVVYALATQFAMRRILVSGRTLPHARKLVRALVDNCPKRAELDTINLRQLGTGVRLEDMDLIVNATPVGGPTLAGKLPLPARAPLAPQTVVFDLNYRPRITALLERAQRSGCRIVGGWPMLVAQAEAAFTVWTGHTFPPKVRQALIKWNPR